MKKNKGKLNLKKVFFISIIVFSVFALDHITKMTCEKKLTPGDKITIIDGYLDIVHVRNRGAAFGIFNTMRGKAPRIFLTGASIIALGILIFYLREFDFERKKRYIFAISLIVGGAVGNLVERVLKGYVVDFIHMHIKEYSWPAYNVADIAITLGVCLLVLFSLTDRN